MFERDRQERTAHVPETNIRILRETTLAELGIDTSSDNLNLASDRLTLGVKQVGEDTVYVGLLKHPFAGVHFAQFLNSVSPFADQNVRGIMGDINLPILAGLDYKAGKDATSSEFIFLHEKHLADDRVGPPYKRFAEDHADSWLRALEFSNGSEVFDKIQRIRFINSTEEVRKQLFSEDGDILEGVHGTDSRFRLLHAIRRYAAERFKLFCRNIDLREDDYNIVRSFLKTLSSKIEQGEFAFMYFTAIYKQIFVVLDSQRIIMDKSDPDSWISTDIEFADSGRNVVISDGKGTRVVITPKGQSNDKFSWKVIEYQFAKGYEESSLYPIIAWKKDGNGTRTFLTQQEAMPQVAELGLEDGGQGDVKLGEIAVAYFARNITKDWPAKMKLKPLERVKSSRGDDFEQSMGGAQMPGWVAVEQHKSQLLKSETSVLALLER